MSKFIASHATMSLASSGLSFEEYAIEIFKLLPPEYDEISCLSPSGGIYGYSSKAVPDRLLGFNKEYYGLVAYRKLTWQERLKQHVNDVLSFFKQVMNGGAWL